MKKILLITLVLVLIAGCTSVRVKTSGASGFENAVRLSVVDTYTYEQVWKLNGQMLGYVETEHCQKESRDHVPSKGSFVDSLKVKAQQLGGNGLVFDSCLVNSTGACHLQTICRGNAYLITY